MATQARCHRCDTVAVERDLLTCTHCGDKYHPQCCFPLLPQPLEAKVGSEIYASLQSKWVCEACILKPGKKQSSGPVMSRFCHCCGATFTSGQQSGTTVPKKTATSMKRRRILQETLSSASQPGEKKSSQCESCGGWFCLNNPLCWRSAHTSTKCRRCEKGASEELKVWVPILERRPGANRYQMRISGVKAWNRKPGRGAPGEAVAQAADPSSSSSGGPDWLTSDPVVAVEKRERKIKGVPDPIIDITVRTSGNEVFKLKTLQLEALVHRGLPMQLSDVFGHKNWDRKTWMQILSSDDPKNAAIDLSAQVDPVKLLDDFMRYRGKTATGFVAKMFGASRSSSGGKGGSAAACSSGTAGAEGVDEGAVKTVFDRVVQLLADRGFDTHGQFDVGRGAWKGYYENGLFARSEAGEHKVWATSDQVERTHAKWLADHGCAEFLDLSGGVPPGRRARVKLSGKEEGNVETSVEVVVEVTNFAREGRNSGLCVVARKEAAAGETTRRVPVRDFVAGCKLENAAGCKLQLVSTPELSNAASSSASTPEQMAFVKQLSFLKVVDVAACRSVTSPATSPVAGCKEGLPPPPSGFSSSTAALPATTTASTAPSDADRRLLSSTLFPFNLHAWVQLSQAKRIELVDEEVEEQREELEVVWTANMDARLKELAAGLRVDEITWVEIAAEIAAMCNRANNTPNNGTSSFGGGSFGKNRNQNKNPGTMKVVLTEHDCQRRFRDLKATDQEELQLDEQLKKEQMERRKRKEFALGKTDKERDKMIWSLSAPKTNAASAKLAQQFLYGLREKKRVEQRDLLAGLGCLDSSQSSAGSLGGSQLEPSGGSAECGSVGAVADRNQVAVLEDVAMDPRGGSSGSRVQMEQADHADARHAGALEMSGLYDAAKVESAAATGTNGAGHDLDRDVAGVEEAPRSEGPPRKRQKVVEFNNRVSVREISFGGADSTEKRPRRVSALSDRDQSGRKRRKSSFGGGGGELPEQIPGRMGGSAERKRRALSEDLISQSSSEALLLPPDSQELGELDGPSGEVEENGAAGAAPVELAIGVLGEECCTSSVRSGEATRPNDPAQSRGVLLHPESVGGSLRREGRDGSTSSDAIGELFASGGGGRKAESATLAQVGSSSSSSSTSRAIVAVDAVEAKVAEKKKKSGNIVQMPSCLNDPDFFKDAPAAGKVQQQTSTADSFCEENSQSTPMIRLSPLRDPESVAAFAANLVATRNNRGLKANAAAAKSGAGAKSRQNQENRARVLELRKKQLKLIEKNEKVKARRQRREEAEGLLEDGFGEGAMEDGLWDGEEEESDSSSEVADSDSQGTSE
eukprot:CAMPEP_0178993638 /NCGR_PEP_ID=MMETSP0795-20121207/6814_1 /TAXON_ID=88552 /ORGANISM="Amoebophrya sp., Strain Ameob2" /LENGTH=1319 /DNA_ID=CAMNT_0020685719 /DNA_START=43 /DNA_END=4002 /DNA_ORIENTATION=-